MISEELKKYLDQIELEGQFDENTIRKQLAGVGWDSMSIEESIEYLRNNRPAVSLSNDINISKQAQNASIIAGAKEDNPIKIAGVVMESNTNNLISKDSGDKLVPAQAESALSEVSAKNKVSRKISLKNFFSIGIAILLITGVSGSLVYAYTNHLWFFASDGPYKIETIVSDIVNGQKQIKSYGFGFKISVSVGARDKDAIPISSSVLSGANSATTTSYKTPLPTDFNLNLDVNGKATLPTTNDASLFESEVNLGGTYVMNSTTAPALSINLSLLKTKEGSFFKVSELPSLVMMFFDATPILGKWVRLEVSTSTVQAYSGYASPYVTDINIGTSTDSKIIIEQLDILVKIIDEQGLVSIVGRPQQISGDNGQKLFKYKILINWDKLANVYKELSKTLAETYGDKAIIKDDPKTLASLTDQKMQENFNYFNNNSKIFVTADENGVPVGWELSFRFVPNEKDTPQYAGKQINFNLTSVLSDINLPQNIKVPDVWMTWEEAMKLLSPTKAKPVPSVKSTE